MNLLNIEETLEQYYTKIKELDSELRKCIDKQDYQAARACVNVIISNKAELRILEDIFNIIKKTS